MICEVCVESLEGARAALEAGAQRIELCSGQEVGGLTPGAGLLTAVRKTWPGPLVVLIRPRRGDFLYSSGETETIRSEIRAARDLGADGVAVGCLLSDGTIDRERMAELAALARPGAITFHRAFDFTRDPFEALETLITLGIDRVLTSGLAPTAPEGIEVLGRLVRSASGRIAVMAGGGLKPENIRQVVESTGVPEVHFSARRAVPSRMRHRNDRCCLDAPSLSTNDDLLLTDAEAVCQMVALARGSWLSKP
jgi:copper homeostasis protein